MQRPILLLAIIGFLFFSFVNWSCSKLDTTDIGSDLLPAVDNVNTFADTLAIVTTQGVFNPDTSIILKTDDHVLGRILNDPLMGQTTANIAMQLKPSFFPYYFGYAKDTIDNNLAPGTGFDSVILCIKYKGFWGDSMVPVQFQVFEVVDNQFRDSVYKANNITYFPSLGAQIGSASIDARRLGDTIKYINGVNYSVNRIRIKLTGQWVDDLFKRDSIKNNSINNAFYNDSLFKRFYNGIAVVANGSGNGLFYTNLADTSTKLEIHFRRKNVGKIDTTFSSFVLSKNPLPSSTLSPSVTANKVLRNRLPLPSGDQEVYLQTSPGTYANLTIPALSGLSNRVIHRAEITIEQIPGNPLYDSIFSAPNYLYLDLKDSGTTNKWKPIYFDLNPNVRYDPDFISGLPVYPQGGIDFLYYGGYKRNKIDKFGNVIKFYTINITRYLQHLVTNHLPNYTLRLFAPFEFQYPQFPSGNIQYYNNIAYGRVKVGGGNNANYKMRLRVVYSKL